MVFYGSWLPWPFDVASWFFAGFHRFQDGFVVFDGFSLSLVVFYFLSSSSFMAFHCSGLFHDFSRYFHRNVLFPRYHPSHRSCRPS